MSLISKKALLFFTLFVFIGLISCSQINSGGGDVTAPNSNEPYVIESLLCSSLDVNNHPVGIATDFPAGYSVYLWVHWANVRGKHTVSVYWYDPNGEEQHRQTLSFNTQENHQITYFYIETSSSAIAGEWLVSLFLDGQFVRSLAFDIIND